MERLPVPIAPLEPVIDGWLFLFCLILTVIFPATTLYGVFTSTIPAFRHSHALRGEISCGIYAILFTGLGAYSFVAGVRLWTVRPGAVLFAKRFLWTFLLAHLAYFALWFLLFQPVSSLSMSRMVWHHVAGALPFFLLWTAYLEHSKRVRETYAETLDLFEIPTIRNSKKSD